MLQEIKKVIKDSSLSVEVKKYVLGLVFQDLASTEFKAHLSDLEVESKGAEPVIGEGAE